MRNLGIASSFLALAVAAAGHAWFHVRADLTLPVPWPDEFHFLVAARAWLESGSFATPELHPERPLMWMPPGYAFAMAQIFRWTGVSLVAARAVSMLCAIVAAVCFWDLLCRSMPRLVATILTMLLLVHPAWIVTGNVARMDAMTLALVCGDFASLRRRWWAAGLSSLFASALVHPNGVVFAFVGVVVVLRRRQTTRPRAVELAIAALVLVAGVAYTVHVVGHFEGFAEDMAFQFSRKANKLKLAAFWSPRALAAYVFAGIAVMPRYRSSVGWLAVLALPAWFVARVGREMWYHPYDVVFVACLVGASIIVLIDLAQVLRPRWGRARFVVFVVGLAGLLAFVSNERPRLPHEIHWRRMTFADQPYLVPGEVAAVASRLVELVPHTPVEFFPRGDAIFFVGEQRLSVVDPVRYDHGAGWVVLHESPNLPRHWRKRIRKRLAEPGAEDPVLVYEREGGRRWWLSGTRSRSR